jgi:hypothetical protein
VHEGVVKMKRWVADASFIGSSSRPALQSAGGGLMARSFVTLAVAWAALQPAAGQPPVTHTFDREGPGPLPAGFELAAMRQDTPGTWLVRRDGANGVLVHQSADNASGFALALAPGVPLRDVQTSVRLRLNSGARAGGLVWRYADASNFYGAILDLAQAEVVLFRVTAGNRTFLEREDDLELDPAAWHTLKVVHDESRIQVSLGGIRVFEERDRRSEQDTAPGKTGVIAAGAAEVWFDDLRIEPDRDRRRER